ncbi:MAG: SLBB domain-containing protein, partial [Gammaproteobacteria bacterium]|nr:SLBB domain-containing protein [Gammaproteobacteria bacterium]
DTDLPLSTTGDTASIARGLRPVPSYPTLRLDEREARASQSPESPVEPLRPTPYAELSDFEVLVRQTLGRPLPNFGAELFGGNSSGFEPVEQASVPPDFVLGPGDEVYIRAWGSVDIDYRATIDRSGAITIPRVGEIPLAGVRFARLRDHVRAAIERSYHGFELSVSLGQLRSIRVYVTGFARAPGSYTVSSLSTFVNVLFRAGGPDRAGDLRALELWRSGERVTTVDFYEFLLSGRHDNEFRLLPEDVLHIPAIAGEVAIAGAVNRPAIYQLRADERLGDLIEFAGGLSVIASAHRVVLERIGDDGQRRVAEYPLTEATRALGLQNGDLVLVQPVSPRFLNAVTLRGQVAQPLRHEWREGMRVSDLLPSSEALVSPRYWVSRNEESQVIKLLEAGPAPAPAFDPDFPDINWDYAAIERVDPVSLSTQLLPFHLGKAILERDPTHDLVLRPGDQITVFALEDFRTRSAQKPRFVKLEGEVARAGIYPVDSGETVHDLIARAGGLTSDAYLFGLELTRASVRAQQARRIHEAIDQLEQDYQRHLIDRSRNVLTGDLSLAISPEAAAIQGLIGRLREAEPSGRIVLELPGDIAAADHLPSLALDDGDTIYVPPMPTTIEVVGAVFRQGSFVYGRDDVRDYVQRAGPLPTADERNVYVIRPDGSFAHASRRVDLQPGDTIIVPEKVDRQT